MRRTRLIGAIACAVGALAVLPAAAPAAVQVGSSGWLWGNPLPQGNTIRAMSFAGTQGYAGGDFGTLLRTTDAGRTASAPTAQAMAPIRRVRRIVVFLLVETSTACTPETCATGAGLRSCPDA